MTMFGVRMVCSEERCGATFDVFWRGESHGVMSCRYCGAPLDDLGGSLAPAGSPDEDPQAPDVQVEVVQAPLSDPRFYDLDIKAVSASSGMDALAESGVVGYRRGGQQAVLIAVDDLRRITSSTALRVEAMRRLQPPTGYTVALQQLAINHFDFDLDAALSALTAKARAAARRVLSDERSPPGQRALALRLWIEDAEGRLGEALHEATVMVDDEYAPLPSEPPPDEPK